MLLLALVAFASLACAQNTARFRIVGKSYIAPIGSYLGRFPDRCYSQWRNRIGDALVPGVSLGIDTQLQAFAAMADELFSENPRNDARDERYRLFSDRTVVARCDNGQISIEASGVSTDGGTECPLAPIGGGRRTCLKADAPRVIANSVTPAGAITHGVYGSPPLALEPPFYAMCPRNSRNIWHHVSVTFACSPNNVPVVAGSNIRGSRFPSHRLFINNRVVNFVAQQGIARLWYSTGALID